MWSPSRLSLVRAVRPAAIAGALCLALSACGFQPLYGEGSGSTNAAELAKIQIDPLPNRLGQLLHNDLRDRLNPRGQPAYPEYRLSIGLQQSTSRFGLRLDETATRAALTVRANFRLIDLETEEVVASGRATSTNSYAIGESPYAVEVAEDDARRRAVTQVADAIRTRISGALAGRGTDTIARK